MFEHTRYTGVFTPSDVVQASLDLHANAPVSRPRPVARPRSARAQPLGDGQESRTPCDPTLATRSAVRRRLARPPDAPPLHCHPRRYIPSSAPVDARRDLPRPDRTPSTRRVTHTRVKVPERRETARRVCQIEPCDCQLTAVLQLVPHKFNFIKHIYYHFPTLENNSRSQVFTTYVYDHEFIARPLRSRVACHGARGYGGVRPSAGMWGGLRALCCGGRSDGWRQPAAGPLPGL